MKLIKSIFVFTMIFFSFVVYSQTEIDSPGENKAQEVSLENKRFVPENINSTKLPVIIFDFYNTSKVIDNKYLSKILPKNIAIEIEKTKSYACYKTETVLKPENLNSVNYSKYIESLGKIAEKNEVKYIVTGSYLFKDKSLSIETHVYISRLKKIVKLTAKRDNIGVLINDILDEMSVKIGNEFKRYIELKSDNPLIEPNSGIYKYYVDVEMDSDLKDVELWYTTDGTKPEKGVGTKYNGETITFYEDTDVNVLAVKDKWKPSDPINRNYVILYQPDLFSMTLNYSYLQFNGNWEKLVDKTFPMMYSFDMFFDLGAIKKVKRNPVIRDFGFKLDFDAAHFATNDATPVHYNLWTGSTGLFYMLRLGRYFTIDATITAGGTHTILSADKDYEGFINYGKFPEQISTSNDLYVGLGIGFRAIVRSIVVTAGYDYHHVEYKNEPMNINAYKIGIGYSF